mgnify:FL=1
MIAREIPKERPNDFSKVLDRVREIVEKVKVEGDRALIELTEKFDGVKLSKIRLSREEVEEEARKLDQSVKRALEVMADQIREFQSSVMPPAMWGSSRGVKWGVVWKPVQRVGIYVPGGAKSYPSTLLMAGVTARVAGVKEIAVATPPNREGKISPAMAYAALLVGADDVYLVGGAQAIAALAYGTESVRRVDKIVGPGNVYVQAAKFLVSNQVGIDGIEGPTELVVVADSSAKAEEVALDMRAQAEHGKSSFVVLITTDQSLAKKVEEILKDDDFTYYVVTAKDLNEAVKIANDIAPEHLSLHVERPYEALNYVLNAGAVTLGRTPPALIDYSAGPNHILPTNGWARFRGGLTVYDFLRPIMVASAESPEREVVESSVTVAQVEGFRVHGESVGKRYL